MGALWTLFLSKRNKKASTGGSGFSDGSGSEEQSIYGTLFVCKAPYKALSISSSSRPYAVLLFLYPFHRWEDWGFKRLANIRIPAQMRGEFLAIFLSPVRAQILLPSLSSSGLGHMTSILWASVSFLVKMENVILNSQGRLRKATKPPVWYLAHRGAQVTTILLPLLFLSPSLGFSWPKPFLHDVLLLISPLSVTDRDVLQLSVPLTDVCC